jgi:methyl-accepting chemotaxis protein
MSDRTKDPDAPEAIVEEAARRGGLLDALMLPRLLGRLLEDVRTIADGMGHLPEIAATLAQIDARVEVLNNEVRRMRAGVEDMGGDVTELKESIERVEPHVEDVNRVAHPLRRIGDRAMGRRRTDDS